MQAEAAGHAFHAGWSAAGARHSFAAWRHPPSWFAPLPAAGTSTNLVVTGQFDSRVLNPNSPYYIEGAKPINLFDLSPYGIPVSVW